MDDDDGEKKIRFVICSAAKTCLKTNVKFQPERYRYRRNGRDRSWQNDIHSGSYRRGIGNWQ